MNSVATYVQPVAVPTVSDWAGTITGGGLSLDMPLYSSYNGHQSLWICNNDIGLSLLLPPEPFWQSDGINDINIIRRGADTLLRLNFYQSTLPLNEQRTYRLYLQATPVRPYNPDWYAKGSRIAHGIQPGDNVDLLASENDIVSTISLESARLQPAGTFEIILQNKNDLKAISEMDYIHWGVDEHIFKISSGDDVLELLFDKQYNSMRMTTPWFGWWNDLGSADNCTWDPNEIHKIAFTWGDKLRFYVDGEQQGEILTTGFPLPAGNPDANLYLGSISARYTMKGLRVSKVVRTASLSNLGPMAQDSDTLYLDNNSLDLRSDAPTYLEEAKELGVEILFYHEYWTEVQNGGQSRVEPLLKNIVEDCHRAGLQVVFYFGFELADLPVNQDIIEECKAMIDEVSSYYPPQDQNRFIVSYGSPYQEFLLYHMERLKNTLGIDGVFLDGSLMQFRTDNPAFGEGIVLPDGTRHPTLPIGRIRQFAKNINKLFAQDGGIVYAQLGPGPAVPTMGFVTNMMYGEHLGLVGVQWNSITELLPLDVSRAIYTGKNTGVPIMTHIPNVLPHLQDFVPDWYEKVSAWADLHRSIFPIMMGNYQSFSSTNENAKRNALADFGADQAQWIPYWEAENLITSNPSDLKVSIYRREDKAMICAIGNMSNGNISGSIDFSGSALTMRPGSTAEDLITTTPVSMSNEEVFVTISAWNGMMILIDSPYPLGDLNQNTKVQMNDFTLLAKYWLQDCSSPEICEGADLNDDQSVGLEDLDMFLNHWLDGIF